MTHVKECNFLWKIENFSVCRIQNRHYIASPVFISNVLDNTSWNLVICLAGEHSDTDHMILNIHRSNLEATQKSPQTVFFDVGLMTKSGKTEFNTSYILDLNSPIRNIFVKRSAVYCEDSSVLHKDVLTLKGRIWAFSVQRTSPEKFFLRSTLRMEKVKMQYIFNPQEYIQDFHINSEPVPAGFKLICVRSQSEKDCLSDDAAPIIIIKPLDQQTWSCMNAKMELEGRLYEPVCRLEDSAHFGSGFEKPWILKDFEGPFDLVAYFLTFGMNLNCEFLISNLENESVLEPRYSFLCNKVLKAENAFRRNVLVNDMRPFFQDSTFADVLVVAGKVRIPAHRVVLSAKSVIFRQLFIDADNKSGMYRETGVLSLIRSLVSRSVEPESPSSLRQKVRESGVYVSTWNGRLSIVFTNVDERVVRKLVLFAYTDDVGCVDHDTAIALLYASKRYSVKGLKFSCESILLVIPITLENVCRTLSASHQTKCLNLKKEALLFINEYMDCVLIHLDSLSSDHGDKKIADNFGISRGKNRNTRLFPVKTTEKEKNRRF